MARWIGAGEGEAPEASLCLLTCFVALSLSLSWLVGCSSSCMATTARHSTVPHAPLKQDMIERLVADPGSPNVYNGRACLNDTFSVLMQHAILASFSNNAPSTPSPPTSQHVRSPQHPGDQFRHVMRAQACSNEHDKLVLLQAQYHELTRDLSAATTDHALLLSDLAAEIASTARQPLEQQHWLRKALQHQPTGTAHQSLVALTLYARLHLLCDVPPLELSPEINALITGASAQYLDNANQITATMLLASAYHHHRPELAMRAYELYQYRPHLLSYVELQALNAYGNALELEGIDLIVANSPEASPNNPLVRWLRAQVALASPECDLDSFMLRTKPDAMDEPLAAIGDSPTTDGPGNVLAQLLEADLLSRKAIRDGSPTDWKRAEALFQQTREVAPVLAFVSGVALAVRSLQWANLRQCATALVCTSLVGRLRSQSLPPKSNLLIPGLWLFLTTIATELAALHQTHPDMLDGICQSSLYQFISSYVKPTPPTAASIPCERPVEQEPKHASTHRRPTADSSDSSGQWLDSLPWPEVPLSSPVAHNRRERPLTITAAFGGAPLEVENQWRHRARL